MSRYNSNNNDPSKRRAANSVISLTKFAHSKSKGTRRAIEKFKQKKRSKFNRNAELLREYKKAMKSEGYDAGRGGSRKRTIDDNDKDKSHSVKNNDDGENHSDSDDYSVEDDEKEQEQPKKRKRFHKSDPLARAKAKAIQSKVEKEQRKEMRLKEIKENEKKMRQKKRKTRTLAKRTKRGQPIMKNVVGDLLEKIKKTT